MIGHNVDDATRRSREIRRPRISRRAATGPRGPRQRHGHSAQSPAAVAAAASPRRVGGRASAERRRRRRDGGGVAGVSVEYKCVTCGKPHKGLPLSFAADSPDMYANMNRDERDARSVRGSDQCIIDRKWFFIRGCLEIPIAGSSDVFSGDFGPRSAKKYSTRFLSAGSSSAGKNHTDPSREGSVTHFRSTPRH